MRSDEKLIKAVDIYFRALYECDGGLLDSVFHSEASLFDVDDGYVRVDPFDVWRAEVVARPSPAGANQAREEEIVGVNWLSEDSATVHVRLRVLSEIFVDHLSFVYADNVFRIVAKTWHLERVV